MRRNLAIALVLVAAWLGGQGAYIRLKAVAAQFLLRRAWASAQAGEIRAHPWPWADTFTVGRLRVPAFGVDQIVLSGTTGRTLAFGPGLVDGTDPPGHCGNCVVSGHRDTHFRFLRNLEVGHEIVLESPDGARQTFEVTALHIVDEDELSIVRDAGWPLLTLITCYPFDAVVPGGPLRYVVSAEAL